MASNRDVDFTSGRLLKKIILYALPIVGVNVLQLFFTAADITVLGIFTNDHAVAAVGACTPIINMLIGFFMGLSVGINVLVARCVGAKDKEGAGKYVGTAVFISILAGIIILIVGEIIAESLLIVTNCDPLVLPYATNYLRIYLIGMPIIMLYNFCAAILRAVGDTLRPLIFLIIGGVVNVGLNIFFVTVVKFNVEGVAIATVASNVITAVSVCVLMIRNDGYAKINRKYFKISRNELVKILVVGLPIALSKILFSFANVIVQSNLNALGDVAMTAHSITKEFDGFILETIHGLGAANLAVISQNFGAKKMDRVKRSALISVGLMLGVSLTLGAVLLVAGRSLCSIMTDTELVLDYCMVRITTISITYVFLGMLSVVQEVIRGIGYNITSLMLSISANIILRVIYLLFIYPSVCIEGNVAHNLRMLYVLYPASWILTSAVGIVILIVLFNRVKNRFLNEQKALESVIE